MCRCLIGFSAVLRAVHGHRQCARMTEDAYEGADDHLVDVKELREFVEKWNAKQSIISYYPDYKRVVVLNWDEEGEHDDQET